MSSEAIPYDLAPMLATPGVLPRGGDWVYEVKWDGVRGLIALDASSSTPIRVTTRLGNDVTGAYPELRCLPNMLGDTATLLDGEIVAFDQGKPSFAKIQERIGVRGRDAEARALMNPVVFVVFDILHLSGHSTRSLPQRDRRVLLEQLPLDAGTSWRLSSVYDDGVTLFESTRAAGLEGVVAKRTDTPYRPGVRSSTWIKIKHNTVDEFVIGGWVPGEGRREQAIGALILGLRSGNEPHSTNRRTQPPAKVYPTRPRQRYIQPKRGGLGTNRRRVGYEQNAGWVRTAGITGVEPLVPDRAGPS